MWDWFVIGQWALAVLLSFFFISVGLRTVLRWRAEEKMLRLRWQRFPGKGIDVSKIAPEVRRVREEPLAALRAKCPGGFYHQSLLAAARSWISQLSFFHRAGSEHELQKRKI